MTMIIVGGLISFAAFTRNVRWGAAHAIRDSVSVRRGVIAAANAYTAAGRSDDAWLSQELSLRRGLIEDEYANEEAMSPSPSDSPSPSSRSSEEILVEAVEELAGVVGSMDTEQAAEAVETLAEAAEVLENEEENEEEEGAYGDEVGEDLPVSTLATSGPEDLPEEVVHEENAGVEASASGPWNVTGAPSGLPYMGYNGTEFVPAGEAPSGEGEGETSEDDPGVDYDKDKEQSLPIAGESGISVSPSSANSEGDGGVEGEGGYSPRPGKENETEPLAYTPSPVPGDDGGGVAPNPTPYPSFDENEEYEDDEDGDEWGWPDESKSKWDDYPTESPSPRPTFNYVPREGDDPLAEETRPDDSFHDDTVFYHGLGGAVGAYLDGVESPQELEKDRNVQIVAGTVMGVFMGLLLITAHLVMQYPDGLCAGCCRLTLKCICCFIRTLCLPCRALCCKGGDQTQSRRTHAPMRTPFPTDLELA